MSALPARLREDDWVHDGAAALGPAIDKALSLMRRATAPRPGPGQAQDEEDATEELPRALVRAPGTRCVF